VEKKCILINAIHPEENRVAIVDRGYLQELEIEAADKVQVKSNIYKGIITRVEPSLQAAFVEYGSAKQGFLPLNEIHSDYWRSGGDAECDPRKSHIQDVIEGRQEILVQVVKEERGNKGAALTTFISLAGRYLVLSPNTARVGISRKLNDEDRRTVKQLIEKLDVPTNMGLIVRTAGKDQELESLQRDFSYLMRLWEEIRMKADDAKVPAFIYLDGDLATRTIRDHFSDDIEEIWVDQYELYQRTKQFVHAVLPGKEKIVKLYRDKVPLFTKYNIEDQCAEIYAREINMASGAQLVFDPTEALTSIDINSGRSTSAKHIDDTALETNLEAAREIARQLRIRDIGGLVVIDFIDMSSRKHAQLVEEELRIACKGDKARIQFARISRFGLLEMSRQRLHLSIRESTSEECPRCQGMGSIRTVESLALHMLIRIDEEAKRVKEGGALVVQMSAEAVDYLSNHKRQNLIHLEDVYKIPVHLQSKMEIDHPHYRIERQWQDDSGQARIEVLEDTAKGKKPAKNKRKFKQKQQPIVGVPQVDSEEVGHTSMTQEGWWKRFLSLFFSSSDVVDTKPKIEVKKKKSTPPLKKRKIKPQNKPKKQGNHDAAPTAVIENNIAENDVSPTTRRRKRRRRNPRREGSEANTSQQQEGKPLNNENKVGQGVVDSGKKTKESRDSKPQKKSDSVKKEKNSFDKSKDSNHSKPQDIANTSHKKERTPVNKGENTHKPNHSSEAVKKEQGSSDKSKKSNGAKSQETANVSHKKDRTPVNKDENTHKPKPNQSSEVVKKEHVSSEKSKESNDSKFKINANIGKKDHQGLSVKAESLPAKGKDTPIVV